MIEQSGKPAHRGIRVSEAEFARLWADQALSSADIAGRLNITIQAVRCRAKSRGLPPRKGGGGCNRKVDPITFRALWDGNAGLADMAAYFRAHPGNLINRARAWGFPERNCTRWNMRPVLAVLMEQTAQQERAAAREGEAVGRCASAASKAATGGHGAGHAGRPVRAGLRT